MAYGSAAAMRGAKGGVFGALVKKAASLPMVKKAVGVGVGFMPGGALVKGAAAMAAGAAGAAAAKRAGTAAARSVALPMPGGATMRPLAATPGGVPFYERKKYRRMNAGNVKALKRAMRRQDAFVKLANDALRGSGYAVRRTGKTVSPKKRCN